MTHKLFFDSSNVFRPPSFFAVAFQTFGAQHLITLGVIAALCALVFAAARYWIGSKRVWLGRLLGLSLLAYAACIYIQQGLTHGLTWENSLPLDLCNLVLIACIISLFRPIHFITEIAYFWGLGGVLQATLTPDLARGFPSWDFAFFFWGHGATLLGIVFLTSDRNFRPHKNSVGRMMIALNAYAVVVGSINAITGWNYGYLCRKPAMPSLFDFLGPWPWYLLSLELIAFLTFLILDRLWRLIVWPLKPDNALTEKFRE
jgi:hypothetical integral membrane protein (TIGR02206 family)